MQGEKLTIADENKNIVEKEVNTINWDIEAASKDGYDCFMTKEMYEQPNGVEDTLMRRLDENGRIKLDDIKINKEDLDKINKVYIVACVIAYHAGLVGKYAIEKFAKIPVIDDIASEPRHSDPFVDENTLIIVSQSDETADTLAELRDAKAKGARVLSITNVVGSSIARESYDIFYILAGPEIVVDSTKSYTTQLTAFYMIVLNLAMTRGSIIKEEYLTGIEQLKQISAQVEKVLECNELVEEIAKEIKDEKDMFYLGRGVITL